MNFNVISHFMYKVSYELSGSTSFSSALPMENTPLNTQERHDDVDYLPSTVVQ